jgi:uncharacterized linocin/CFP29 family protein
MTGGVGGRVKVELVGAVRYGYKGDKFEQNKHYIVKADRAKLLLRLASDTGLLMFKEVGKDHVTHRVVKAAPVIQEVPVVDTTKSLEDQFQDVLDAEAKNVEVVDITEPEAEAAPPAEEEGEVV